MMNDQKADRPPPPTCLPAGRCRVSGMQPPSAVGASCISIRRKPSSVKGDEEDRRGEPFVGPAGDVLNRALKEAGLDRRSVYLTNAVKHFRFVVEGKRRKHQAPRPSHIAACRLWLEAEIDSIGPHVIVCLGATAARSLLGQGFRLTKKRGKALKTDWAPHVVATFHPSAVLRGIDAKFRETLYESLVHDLKVAADLL